MFDILAFAALALQPAPPFADEIAAFKRQDALAMPPRCATLFVGSSTIRMWPHLADDFAFPVIQRGFGGSTIADVERYFDDIVIPYKPARIVLYAGDNDIDAKQQPADLFARLKRLLDRKTAALGATPVYFVSVKPSPSRIGQIADQRALNAMVKGLAAERADLVYVDTAATMLTSGSPDPALFREDMLHMNQAGYDRWRATVDRALAHSKASAAPGCSTHRQ